MKYDDINLARNHVASPRRRRLVHRAMIIYLLLSVIALVTVIHFSVCDIREGVACYQETKLIKQQFEQSCPEEPGMLDCADRLLFTLEENRKIAGDLEAALPTQIYSILPVLKSIINQSDESFLNKLAFDLEDKGQTVLEFSIAVPSSGRSGPSSEFIQNWRNNPALTNQLAAITPMTTKRGTIRHVDVFIMNYRGTFKE